MKNPVYGLTYAERDKDELFGLIGVCPSNLDQTTIGTLDRVACFFHRNGKYSNDVKVEKKIYYNEGTNPRNCFQVDATGYAAYSKDDFIQCTVGGNSNALIDFYGFLQLPDQRFFQWTVLERGRDIGIGLLNWYIAGREYEYQINTIHDEFRFKPSNKTYDILFTVQWDFIGSARYKRMPGFDFLTGVGVLGGYIFLAIQLYHFLIFSQSAFLTKKTPLSAQTLDTDEKDKKEGEFGAL